MPDETSERLRATGDEVKGKVQKAWGELTDDEALEAEGRANEAKGKLRHAKEDVVDTVEEAVDNVTGDRRHDPDYRRTNR